MADDISKNITIGVEMDTDKLTENITNLNKSIDGLLAKQGQLNDAGQKNSAAFDSISAKLDVLQKKLQDATAQLIAHNNALSTLGTTSKTAANSISALADQHQKNAKAASSSSIKIKELNGQLNALGKSAKQQKTNTDKSKSALDKYAASASKSASGAKKLQGSVNKMTGVLTGQAGALNSSKTSFDAHKTTMDHLKTSFDEIKNVSGIFGPSLKEAANGFNAMKNGLSIVKGGLTGIGEAIKADGFDFLLQILQYLFDSFVKSADGSKILQGAISAIGVVLNTVKGFIDSVKSAMLDAVTHPVDSLKSLGAMIEQNIINRFKAFSVILDGIIHLDFKKVANGAIQAFTGVTNATDKIAKGIKVIKNGIIQTAGQMQAAYKKGYNQINGEVDKNTGKVKDSVNAQIEYYKKLLKKAKEAYEAQKKQAKESKSIAKSDEDCKCDEQKPVENQSGDNNNTVDDSKIKEQQAQEKQMEKDQENVSNAKDDETKLAADKKLITDKYQFEIAQAKGNSDNIIILQTELNTKLQALQNTFDKKKADAKKADQQKIKDEILKDAQQIEGQVMSLITDSIKQQSAAKIAGLEKDKTADLSNSSLTSAQRLAIQQKYKQQEAQIKTKAFKEEQEASIAQAVINGALAITKGTAQTGVLGELYIPIIIAETAIQVAKIAAQKPPAYAKGGLHYASDGRGGVLPGYSKTDNMNAYLRSGEGIVVSEAMQVPWARNLVSAINVGFGGRDFSVTNPGRGYAVGGIFTDGGDANRYYNAPVTDQKNLANTIAYQMINNFPPVYVDVKDVNNQQNILAQTINRVNL